MKFSIKSDLESLFRDTVETLPRQFSSIPWRITNSSLPPEQLMLVIFREVTLDRDATYMRMN